MTYFIISLGVLLIIAGIIMMINPDLLLNFVKKYHTSFILQIFASFFRIIIGLVMYLVAPHTRFPLTFEVIGILVVVIGIIIILIPPSKFQLFVDKMIDTFIPYARIVSVVALLFGAWLIYAVW